MGAIGPEQVLFGPDGEQYNKYATVALGLERLPIGTQLIMQDGRKYRFTRAGATALVVGDVITGAAVTTDVSLAPTATAAGAVSITLTTVTTNAANFYAQGWAYVSVTPGFADTYKILSHLLLTGGAGDIINLMSTGGIRQALTTVTRMGLVQALYKGVIQAAATTLTGSPVGVAISTIALNGTGWLATRGPHAVLGIGTLIRGANAVSPTGTAGGCGPSGASTSVNIGRVMDVSLTTQSSLIDLALDG